MIATQNQHIPQDSNAPPSAINADKTLSSEHDVNLHAINNDNPAPQLFLSRRAIIHDPATGLNPLVDACGYLFTILGKLKAVSKYRQFHKLQKELIQEVNTIQENIKNHGYNPDYILVCRYVLCATLDDVIGSTAWGGQGQWEKYALLVNFKQDAQVEKFFSILDRAIKEPTLYIDLMELIYICISMGYKGSYRSTEHGQYQLEQITHNLYQHIRAYRGSFSKRLSSLSFKTPPAPKNQLPMDHLLRFVFFLTACTVMVIFISLGYLMDVKTNEAYQDLKQLKSSTQEPAS